MDLAPDLVAARLAAARVAALQASYAQLENGPGAIRIELYADPRPAPGEAVSSAALAVIELAGDCRIDGYRLILPTPGEGQIAVADIVTWGRIFGRVGNWFADVSVSDQSGNGEIKMDRADFMVGAFARLITAEFRG